MAVAGLRPQPTRQLETMGLLLLHIHMYLKECREDFQD